MKLATYKWNISYEDENQPLQYYGFKTKKEAQQFADNWNSMHERKIKVVRY